MKIPFTIYKENEAGADATEDTLESDRFKTGYVYVITQICAIDITTQCSSYIAVGYVQAGMFHPLKATKPSAGQSCDWQGELHLYPGSFIRCRFVNTTSGDDIFMTVNGYKKEVE